MSVCECTVSLSVYMCVNVHVCESGCASECVRVTDLQQELLKRHLCQEKGKQTAQAARDWLGTYHPQERFGEANSGLGRKTVWPSFGSGMTWKWQQADVL